MIEVLMIEFVRISNCSAFLADKMGSALMSLAYQWELWILARTCRLHNNVVDRPNHVRLHSHYTAAITIIDMSGKYVTMAAVI
jgi:hypothetical protein